MNKRKSLMILSTLIILCLLGTYLIPVSAKDNVLDSVTKICSAYPGRVTNDILKLYVTDDDFTLSDGVAAEIESMDSALEVSFIQFEYGSQISEVYEVEDLIPINTGDKITFIMYDSAVHRLPGASIRGLVGIKYEYSVCYHKGSENATPFKTESGRAKTGTDIPYDIESHIPEGYTASYVLSGRETVGPVAEENVLHVIYNEKRADYSYLVRYLGSGGEPLLPDKAVTGAVYEDNITETAPFIPGYMPDASEKSIIIGSEENLIVFNYVVDSSQLFPCTVNYYMDSEVLPPFKTVTGGAVLGSDIYFDALSNAPDGYTGDYEITGKRVISATGENVLNVIYTGKRSDLSYEVNYLDPGGNEILPAKTVSNVTFAQGYTETAPVIAGYMPNSASKSITITTGANLITFSYAVDQAQTFAYTVRYYRDGTGGQLLKTETGRAVINTVIPYGAEANKPNGYTGACVVSGQKTVTDIPQNNILSVVYNVKRADLSYRVVYLGPDGKDILTAKTVSNVTFAQAYTETAPSITGYKADAASKSITVSTGTNQITFSYTADKAQAKSLSINAIIDKEYLIPISYQNMKTKDTTLKLTYDRAKLQLMDITAQTYGANLTTGDSESAARLEILSNSNGVVTFKLKQSIGNGEMGGGEATIVKFKGLSSGNTTVTIESL